MSYSTNIVSNNGFNNSLRVLFSFPCPVLFKNNSDQNYQSYVGIGTLNNRYYIFIDKIKYKSEIKYSMFPTIIETSGTNGTSCHMLYWTDDLGASWKAIIDTTSSHITLLNHLNVLRNMLTPENVSSDMEIDRQVSKSQSSSSNGKRTINFRQTDASYDYSSESKPTDYSSNQGYSSNQVYSSNHGSYYPSIASSDSVSNIGVDGGAINTYYAFPTSNPSVSNNQSVVAEYNHDAYQSMAATRDVVAAGGNNKITLFNHGNQVGSFNLVDKDASIKKMMSFDGHGKFVVYDNNKDGNVLVVDAERGVAEWKMPHPGGVIKGVTKFSENENVMLVASTKGLYQVDKRIGSGGIVGKREQKTVIPDGIYGHQDHYVAAPDEKGDVRLYKDAITDSKATSVFSVGAPILYVSISNSARYVLMTTAKKLVLWNTTASKNGANAFTTNYKKFQSGENARLAALGGQLITDNFSADLKLSEEDMARIRATDGETGATFRKAYFIRDGYETNSKETWIVAIIGHYFVRWPIHYKNENDLLMGFGDYEISSRQDSTIIDSEYEPGVDMVALLFSNRLKEAPYQRAITRRV